VQNRYLKIHIVGEDDVLVGLYFLRRIRVQNELLRMRITGLEARRVPLPVAIIFVLDTASSSRDDSKLIRNRKNIKQREVAVQHALFGHPVNLNGLTSKATILAKSVSASLWYFTRNVKWLWMKCFSSFLCHKDMYPNEIHICTSKYTQHLDSPQSTGP
jgi:hypothetical protein